jgi:hypothetical protein
MWSVAVAALWSLSALPPGPLPAGAVVVGTAGLDDDATAIGALVVDGDGARLLPVATLAHRAGFVPAGAVVDDRRLVFAVRDGAARDARVVVLDVDTGATRTLVDEVVPEQAPVVVQDAAGPAVVVVRPWDVDVAGATFDVLRVDVAGGAAEVLASRRALWVTPVRGALARADLRFLVKDGGEAGETGDGGLHIDAVVEGAFVPGPRLPWRSARTPVLAGPAGSAGAVLLEAAVPAASSSSAPTTTGRRAALVDDAGAEHGRGLAGMDLVVTATVEDGVDDGVAGGGAGDVVVRTVAVGTGRKDGSLRVLRRVGDDDAGRWQERRAGAVGVARPRAVTAGGDVVVWLDRGASQPGALWLVRADGTSLRLLPPRPRFVVQVYGVVAPPPASSSAPTSARPPSPPGASSSTPVPGVRP